jgi:diguanylate cyclase (GGDEF)-like protein
MALDPLPSAGPPALGDALLAMLRTALEPAAIALDNALMLAKAEALSVTDDLTGLSNSRYLSAVLRREEKRSVRSGRPLSLLFIDLDGFKDVNTKYGHQAGSRTLVEVGGVIRSCARETDVVGRYGGDEFAVVLPDTVVQGAAFVARRICERIRTSRYLAEEGLFIQVTASVGVATLPDAASSAEDLLRAADRAMYWVKNAGKNGLHIAEKDI